MSLPMLADYEALAAFKANRRESWDLNGDESHEEKINMIRGDG